MNLGELNGSFKGSELIHAYTLQFPQKPLYTLQGGHASFSLAPLLGYFVMSPDKGWLRVKVSKVVKGERPDDFDEEEIVCVYVLYYDNENIKVGTSRLGNVVNRIYSQAPLVGVIASVIQPNKKLPLEHLEKEIIKQTSKRKLGTVLRTKPNLNKIIDSWNNVINGKSELHKKLEETKRTMMPLNVLERLAEISKVAWEVACKYGDPLYGYASHWLIPQYPKGQLPPPRPTQVKLKEGQEIYLKFHPNGLFSIRTSQLTLDGGNEFTCDFGFLSKYSYEVIPYE
jgi:hypothetical protein